MHIAALPFTIASLFLASPQSPDSTDLDIAILRETVGYANGLATKMGKGPVLVDEDSFKRYFGSARLGSPSQSALLRFADRRNSKTTKESEAIPRDSRGWALGVSENGLFVRLSSIDAKGDSARVEFITTYQYPLPAVKDYPVRVGSQLREVIFARSDGKWRVVRRTELAGS